MANEFSGEQKLRIVLESIIRNVSKSEQSKKYGVPEEEFQKWHDHLIQNGGKLFESSLTAKSTLRPKRVKRSKESKFLLFMSILINVGLIAFGAYYTIINDLKFESVWPDQTENPLDQQPVIVSEVPSFNEPVFSAKTVPEEVKFEAPITNDPFDPEKNSGQYPLDQPKPKDELFKKSSIFPQLDAADLPKDVSFLGKTYDGRHVVYLLDVGTYVIENKESVAQFDKIKKGLISSILSLSPNSYFNLVMYWNLREASALGPTILKASKENKKYAEDWINSLGDTKESIKVERNQYYSKEVLYTKPSIGIIGPWYALSMAISFDPDLVFVISGNLPDFDRSEVPRSHYDGLGNIKFESTTTSFTSTASVSSLTRETAMKWFYSITPVDLLPSSEQEAEKMALAKLGISMEGGSKTIYEELPWGVTFENFISSLEVGFDQIPKTHFILSLPRYTSWPSSLSDSAKEFTESSRGTFQENLFLR